MGILNIDEHVEEHRLLNIRYPSKAVIPGSSVIALSPLPFWLPPGDGGANGLAFSGSGGDFTLATSILAGSWPALAAAYFYMPANFGGSSYPAGWYYGEMSSETAGKLYTETYAAGSVARPSTKTVFPVNLTGRITAPTAEVVGPQGFLMSGGSLGKKGVLQIDMQTLGSTTGNKTFRVRANDAGTTNIVVTGTAASPAAYSQHLVNCVDSHTEKFIGRSSTSLNSGVGGSATSLPTSVISFDTSVDVLLNFTLQGSSNLSAPAIVFARAIATYGE